MLRRKTRGVKLFLDESVPLVIKKFLVQEKVDLVDVYKLGLSGSDDGIVFAQAQKEGRVFVTVDLKFVTKIFLSRENHSGVILLRYKGQLAAELLKVFKELLKKYSKKSLKNVIIVLDKEKFRIRRM